MKILVCNDDGISSPGIFTLVKALKEIADVTVIAPLSEQSAIGHAITMQVPLRVSEYRINGTLFGLAVDGTPADCIKIGIRNLMDSPPDLVVSGINHGSNTAINIIYSGTVSAAREAAIMDVPSMAVSVTNHNVKEFSVSAKFTRKLIEKIPIDQLPTGTLLNVNIPDLPEDKINGVKITTQGKSKWDDIYERRVDPYGKDYYWLTGELLQLDKEFDTDQGAINKNYVSITPVHFDLTDYETYNKMKDWKLENLLNEK